ncbi:unnamed protein product, partial [Laminaria digitata]
MAGSSEGRESDDSPEVFATLMFQLPSDFDVEGGVFKVFDPSLPPPPPPGASASAAAATANNRDLSVRCVYMHSSAAGPDMYYTAFYTDCERELSQVTRGRLLTLVYNLQRAPTSPRGRVDIGGIPVQMEAAGRSQRLEPDSMSEKESSYWLDENAAFFSPASWGGRGGGGRGKGRGRGGGGGRGKGGGGGGGSPGAGGSASTSPTGAAMVESTSGKVGFQTTGTTSTVVAQEAAVTALADALRRRGAVLTNPPEVPQPANALHVRDIADVVREWSVAADAPEKLVLALSYRYPLDGVTGESDLKGRDRAVCNLLRLAREVLTAGTGGGGNWRRRCCHHREAEQAEEEGWGGGASTPALLSAPRGGEGEGGGGMGAVSSVDNHEAGLDVFLTRLVVSHGREDMKVFTTGPLIPLEPGDEPPQV